MIPVALVLWGIGWLLLFRVPLCRRPETGAGAAAPAVSVIIPARNEAANLPVLLASLLRPAPAPAEILVVDDGSTDATAEVARAHGATVLTSAPLPDGWRGKTWACHQGALAARGELFCFVDADAWFEAGGLARVVAEWRERGGALSVAAWQDVPTWTEQLSAFFNLMMAAGVGAFTVLGRRMAPAGLFGPFLLVSRHEYNAAGGHAGVRNRILENVYMAARFRQAGVPATCRGGRGVVSIRMYPGGVRELSSGWTKAFASGAANTPPGLLLMAVAWMAGAMIAFLAPLLSRPLAPLPATAWASVYLLYALQFALQLRRLGGFRFLTSLLYPIPLLFYLVVFTGSMLRMGRGQPVAWKGRSIRPDRFSGGRGNVD